MNQETVKSMIRRIYTAFTSLFLVGVLGWFGWFHFSSWNSEQQLWSEGLDTLESKIAAGSLTDLKEGFAKALKDYPSLLAVTLTSQEGLVLITSRHPGLLPPETPQILPPLYHPVFPWEQVVNKRITSPQGPFILQYFYQSLNRADLFETLKNLLFILLCVTALSLIFWIATRDKDQDEAPAPETGEKSESFELEDEIPPLNQEPSSKKDPFEEEFWIQDEPGFPQKEDLDFELPPLTDFEQSPDQEDDWELEAPEGFESPEAPRTPPLPKPVATVDRTDPFDSETGAMREEFLSFRLESELQRASDHNQDLVLAYICPDHRLKPGEAHTLRDLLSEIFPYKDLIFQKNDSGFTLIMPQKTLEVAVKELGTLFKRPPMARFSARITAGLSSRSGRLLDPETLQKETQRALEKAKAGHESIIGFRADPEKYRRHLSL